MSEDWPTTPRKGAEEKIDINGAKNAWAEMMLADKRATFAAMAMQGILAGDHAHEQNAQTVSAWSVQLADALIEELKK